jgi:glyoxylase-like metal-dependent hydrolase (beta-lactamase superfamily II)
MSDREEASTQTEEPAPPVLNGTPAEVAEGVYVIPDGRVPLVPNVGIVLGERDALVVDTAMGPRNGAAVRRFAEDLAGDRPLLLTITHFHPEHSYGAQAFVPGATIVYNRAQRDELGEKGQPYLEMFRTFGPGVAEQLDGVELVEPHMVYDGEADLELGARSVELRTWGLAHTRSDQVVFLPEDRVLFTGDLVESRFFPIFPYFPPDDSDVDGTRWISVLEELERLEPAIVVPGHGEVGGGELITAVRECIVALRSETRRLAAEGHSADEIAAALEPEFRGRYPDWDQPEWIGFGVRSFHAALST